MLTIDLAWKKTKRISHTVLTEYNILFTGQVNIELVGYGASKYKLSDSIE